MDRKITYGLRGREVTVGELIEGMEGWQDVIKSLVDDLFDLGWDGKLLQIKEKFGGLRFYIDTGTSEMFDRIDKAERASVETCMLCGQPGEQVNTGWILTLCERHTNELSNPDTDTDSAAV